MAWGVGSMEIRRFPSAGKHEGISGESTAQSLQ